MSFPTPFSQERAVKSFFFAAVSISHHFIFFPIFLSAASSDMEENRELVTSAAHVSPPLSVSSIFSLIQAFSKWERDSDGAN